MFASIVSFKETEGFSGAELAGLCREAGTQAILRALACGTAAGAVRVIQDDLSAALATWRSKRACHHSTIAERARFALLCPVHSARCR